MEGSNLIITVNWVYFLGIVGGVVLLAWKAGERFSKIETDIKWIIRSLKKLDVNNENEGVGAFASRSPISLTPTGEEILKTSSFKQYIDSKEATLLEYCEGKHSANSYEVQQDVFQMFDDMKFDEETDNRLKEFAFNRGVSMGLIRRTGAIYFRDICLNRFGMKQEDIDVHDPEHDKRQRSIDDL